ncbi:hypothetical protein [Fulvivirga sp.]|uniref:hypothetical protein n=1 Tax=Fulvivirga sp. TaxID=1931237 RepID=UPI0032EF6ECC
MRKSTLLIFLFLFYLKLHASNADCNSDISVVPDDVTNKISVEVNNNGESYDYVLYGWLSNSYQIVAKGSTSESDLNFENLEDNVVYKVKIDFKERSGFCQFRQVGGIIL